MSDRLLLVLPLRIRAEGDAYLIDSQAANGLRLWLENFGEVTLMCPQEAGNSGEFSRLDSIPGYERLTTVPLPSSWTPKRFVAALPATASILKQHILRSNYLHFAIGGLWGDWASVACLLAYRLQLRYAVWTDRVESEVARFDNQTRSGLRRGYWSLNIAAMTVLERYVIRRSALGLFHGMDCYNVYSRFSCNPHLVDDVATNEEDLVSEVQLASRFANRHQLRIAYAGRAHREKGVFDWIDTLSKLDIDFSASWFGDGPELESARRRVKEMQLESRVKFVGAVSHQTVLSRLKEFDVFLFCHKTPESPRCLIEALQCGLPLIGYETAYPKMLIKGSAGLLSDMNDVAKLASALELVSRNSELLKKLTLSASSVGSAYSDQSVFRHRSELMRTIPVNIR